MASQPTQMVSGKPAGLSLARAIAGMALPRREAAAAIPATPVVEIEAVS